MRPCSMKEQRGDSGARDRRAEEEESREREVNIKVHSLKRLVTPLILYLLTHHERDTGSPTVCVFAMYVFYVCACLCACVREAEINVCFKSYTRTHTLSDNDQCSYIRVVLVCNAETRNRY